MRAVLQRVSRASVEVAGQIVGRIDVGWLVLLGVAKGDHDQDADRLAEKVVGLRAFEDDVGKMNMSVAEVSGSVLVVSQFTPCSATADQAGGRASSRPLIRLRPSDSTFVSPTGFENWRLPVETGIFRADMKVELVNDGPVTLLLDSRKAF